ncbi:MAG: hypothetical protein HKN13_04495 [Rhodothermales bacterium]|nr:hypothetical protein [Rhodothermales bacterium]
MIVEEEPLTAVSSCKRVTFAIILLSAPLLLLSSARGQSGPIAPEGTIDIGNRLELFVDHHLIDSVAGVELLMHHPHLMKSAHPPSTGHYATILKDGNLFRMYNRGGVSGYDGDYLERTEYFESNDGIQWRRPNLGLFEVDGSLDNNVVLAHDPPFSHNFSPFIDTRPGVAGDQRFKALAGTEKSGLFAFVSADGVNWRKLQTTAVFTDGLFDSQNVSFWSDHEQQYICYFRTWTGDGYTGLRTISRTTSRDFLNWSPPVALNPNAEGEHLYTSGTHPYFRAPHIYIALATRFQPDRGAATDILLMTSRGGDRFDRTFMEAFIRPGLDSLHWANRANYAAVGVIPTGEGEMSIYVRGRRYALRTDGFASVHAGYDGGSMTTRTLLFDGNSLVLNVATSASGQVLVEILDADGATIDGYSLGDADPIVKDSIATLVSWNGSTEIGQFSGVPIRLRFHMQDADLYALRFR